MSIAFDKKLEDMIAKLKSWNAWLVANGQGQSVQFLDMARLELQFILNKISDGELKALCDALDQAKSSERILPGSALTTFERLDKAENRRIMQLALGAQNGPVRKH